MSDLFDKVTSFQQRKKFMESWFSNHQFNAPSQPLESIIESIKTLENNSIFSNSMVVVYSTQDFTPYYISKNVEKIIGYSQEEFLGWKEGAFFKIGAINQPNYYTDLLKGELQFEKETPHKKSGTKARVHVCGVRYQCKDGTTKQFLLRQEFMLGGDLKIPPFGVIYYEDISHLFKGDDYWFLFETNSDGKTFSKFFRKDGVDNYPISAREKEILMLIAARKSTKQIASELNISPETVGQHRKNMIKRTMAKDSSSLIQLCKMCSVL